MGHISVTMKLYRPGSGKRALLENAMARYDEAFRWLTAQASGRLHEFHVAAERGQAARSAHALRSWVDSDMGRQLNRFGVQPFKDALKNDFSAWMAGYLARRERNPGARFVPARKRAMLFCRYDTKRDWCLLYNPQTDRFYAKLFVANRDGSMRNLHPDDPVKLIHVHRDRTPLADATRMIRYLVLPLAFGKRQETLLKEAIRNPERFKSARLVKRDGAFYLIASMETELPQPVSCHNRLGIARAMDAAFSWTAAGLDGRILAQGIEPMPPHAMRADGDWCGNAMHALANRMVALCKAHGAQAVVAPLDRKGDHLHWVDDRDVLCGPSIDGRTWNRVLGMLHYKLPMHGMPAPVQVSPNNMFRSCPACGHATRRNRMSRSRFLCVHCGHTQALDEIGSQNLATRLQQYDKAPVRVTMQDTPAGTRFRQETLGLDVTLRRDGAGDTASCLATLEGVLADLVARGLRTEDKACAREGTDNDTCGISAGPALVGHRQALAMLHKLGKHSNPLHGIRLVPVRASDES